MHQISAEPASLTKDRLKNDLTAHNIGLPPGDSRKDAYVKLYLKHLTPLLDIQAGDGDSPMKSEFSSDEESTPVKIVKQKRTTKKSQRVIKRDNDIEIEIEKEVANLSDRELAEKLKEFGLSPGPIISSTRGVYERKLVKLRIDGPEEKPQTNGSDEFSDSDEDNSSEEDVSQETEVLKTEQQVRKRVTVQEEESKTETVVQKETSVATSSTKGESKTETETKKRFIPVFVQIIILLLVALLIFLVLYNMESLPQGKIPDSLPGSGKLKLE